MREAVSAEEVGDLGLQRGLHQQWRAEPRGLLQIPDSGRP